MKNVKVITLNGLTNFGNRLQNYALIKYLNNNFNCNTCNLWNNKYKYEIKMFVKTLLTGTKKVSRLRRLRNFYEFDKYIPTNINKNNKDIIVYGSDQIWNPEWAADDTLLGLDISGIPKISYAASFGVDKIDESKKDRFFKALTNFDGISVREEKGKDVEVVLDPTMLLTASDWDTMCKKPKKINKKRYILNYFLGELSDYRKNEIERIAKENNCEIINILDINSPFYTSGPSEFLWLEKNAFLICTDSFHSSVFALLFNRPFVVFDREEKNISQMNSRIDTLINKFNLKNRRYNNKNITNENLEHDYSEAYLILDEERKKAYNFINKSINK